MMSMQFLKRQLMDESKVFDILQLPSVFDSVEQHFVSPTILLSSEFRLSMVVRIELINIKAVIYWS